MTATVEEAVVETSSADDEPDIAHLSCHCTENKIGWCGIDLSDVPLSADPFDLDEDDCCPLCALVLEQMGDEHCPWGCSCSKECGPIEEEPLICFGIEIEPWQEYLLRKFWGRKPPL